MPCSQSVSLLLPTSQRNPDFSSMGVGSDDPFEPLGPLEFLGIRVEHPVRFLHVRDGASPSALALPFHRRILLCP
jgi:hypothetical protein